jgi:hypothetical protein
MLLNFDDHEPIRLLDQRPTACAERLVARKHNPPVADMVNTVLLLERHLDRRRAISGSTLAPTGPTDIH